MGEREEALLLKNITDMAELRRIAESYIRNELIRLEGVAEVTLSGEEVTTLTIRFVIEPVPFINMLVGRIFT